MHVKIFLPGMMEGEVQAKDGNGRKVQLSELAVQPFFFRPDGKPLVVHLASVDDKGNIIQRYALAQAGTSGELTLLRRTPCKTLLDSASSGDLPMAMSEVEYTEDDDSDSDN